jgi:hypothetical protein
MEPRDRTQETAGTGEAQGGHTEGTKEDAGAAATVSELSTAGPPILSERL